MSKEEFLRKLNEEFPGWCANRDRSEASWWLSLEEYCEARYHEARRAETAR